MKNIRKHMKRAAALITASVMFLTVFSCGQEKESTESSASDTGAGTTASQESGSPVTLNATVHLREEASITAASITQISQGTQVELLEYGEDWCRILYDGSEGWVYTEYLDNASPEAEGTASVSSADMTEDTDTEDDSVTEDAETTETSSYEITTVTPDGSGGLLTDSGYFDVSSLSNTSIPYGNDWDDKDAKGLPNGVYYYENMYGKYGPVYYINTNEKILYLTMDEGYEAGNTPTILDILKEKGVHAVFFLTKEFVDGNPDLVQRMIDEGHTLGNHTCRHPSGGYPNYVSENGLQSFIDDISSLHKQVYDTFGYTMKLFRFPEGESSEMLMAELYNLGYTPVFWTYAHKDYVLDDQPDVSVTLDRCLSHMGCGSIYLLHAVSSSNTAALADFIDQARAAGYTFGEFPVDEVTAGK